MNRTGKHNSPPAAIFRYGVVVLAVSIVLGIKLLLEPLIDLESPFLLFFTAVIVSALYGGIQAGVLATILSALISSYLFLSPSGRFFAPTISQNITLTLFILEALFISKIIHQLTTANQRVKSGQQALQESEARYRLLIESAQDYAIFLLDPKGAVASWNQGAQRLKGYQAKEIIGQHFSCFYPEEDLAQNKPDRYLQIAAAQGYVENEGWRVRKDGSRFWANATITALRDEKGNLTGFSKLTRDLSERKRAEDSRQQAYSELELRIEDRSVQLTVTNRELEQQIEERKKAEAALQESERRFRTATDIHEQKQVQEALRQSEERFRVAVDNIPDTFVIYDAERRLQFMNAKGLSRIQKPLEALLGCRDEEIYPPEVTKDYLPFLLWAVETLTTQSFECTT
ncbi:MAG: PAS domain S-box protein, partial [Phormidium sp.]